MAQPIPRTQASSGDEEFFQEALDLSQAVGGDPSEIPANLDDVLLGQDAVTDPEIQYQRGQEVSVMQASLGWQYTVEALHKMVQEYKIAHDDAIEDVEILRTHREWKAAEKIVNRIIALVDVAAQTPHPDDLPE